MNNFLLKVPKFYTLKYIFKKMDMHKKVILKITNSYLH